MGGLTSEGTGPPDRGSFPGWVLFVSLTLVLLALVVLPSAALAGPVLSTFVVEMAGNGITPPGMRLTDSCSSVTLASSPRSSADGDTVGVDGGGVERQAVRASGVAQALSSVDP